MFVILYTLPNTSWYQVQFLSATQSYPIYLYCIIFVRDLMWDLMCVVAADEDEGCIPELM